MARARSAPPLFAGRYRVKRMLAEGGMGVVLLAIDEQTAKRVALKIPHPRVDLSQNVVRRFIREAQTASTIQSSHACRILDVGTLETGTPFMVMEYLVGTDIENLLRMSGPLPVREAALFVSQACEGVREAHAAGVVHRDLKPSNLFVTARSDGSVLVKVLDFGISKWVDPDAEDGGKLTTTTDVMGSPAYMSPEQLRSTHEVGLRSDVWALGVVLYELLAGVLPFQAKTVPAMSAMILRDDPPRLREQRADIPEALEAIVMRCLEKDPAKRFAHAGELEAALAPFRANAAEQSWERIVSLRSTPRHAEEQSVETNAQTLLAVTTLVNTRASSNARRRWVPWVGAAIGLAAIAGVAIGARTLFARAGAGPATDVPVARAPDPPQEPSASSAAPTPSPPAVSAPATASAPSARPVASASASAGKRAAPVGPRPPRASSSGRTTGKSSTGDPFATPQ